MFRLKSPGPSRPSRPIRQPCYKHAMNIYVIYVYHQDPGPALSATGHWAGACSQSWRRSIPVPRGFGRIRRIPAEDWDWKLDTSWHILTHLDTISTLKRIAVINLRLYWDNRCCPAVALSVHFKAFQGKRDSWHQGKKVRILGLHGEEHQKYNGKNGAIMAFDPATGRYSVQLSVQTISTSDLFQVFEVGLIRMRAPTSAPQQPEWPPQYSHNPRSIIVRS